MRRVLPIDEAAEYVGCKNAAQFQREVDANIWPKPLPIISRPRRWDRLALDAHLNAMGGLDEKFDGDQKSDPWMERLGSSSIGQASD